MQCIIPPLELPTHGRHVVWANSVVSTGSRKTVAIRRHMTRCLRLMKPDDGPAINDSDNRLIMNRERFDIRRGGKKEVKTRFRERKPYFSRRSPASLLLEYQAFSRISALSMPARCARGEHTTALAALFTSSGQEGRQPPSPSSSNTSAYIDVNGSVRSPREMPILHVD